MYLAPTLVPTKRNGHPVECIMCWVLVSTHKHTLQPLSSLTCDSRVTAKERVAGPPACTKHSAKVQNRQVGKLQVVLNNQVSRVWLSRVTTRTKWPPHWLYYVLSAKGSSALGIECESNPTFSSYWLCLHCKQEKPSQIEYALSQFTSGGGLQVDWNGMLLAAAFVMCSVVFISVVRKHG